MSTIKFIDNINHSIKIMNGEDIEHPNSCSFFSEEEIPYPIQKIYINSEQFELFSSGKTTLEIVLRDFIYDADYERLTVYPITINGIEDSFVLKKGHFKSEEELVKQIELQNRAAEFGLSDPIYLAYILDDEYGLVMKKYDEILFKIFDSEYYDLEDKMEYVDKIKIMLEDLVEKAKISHGNFNLGNIMVDKNDDIKLVDFENGCFLKDEEDPKKYVDINNFTEYGFYLDTITEQVTFDLENYWYQIMEEFTHPLLKNYNSN